MYEDVNKVEKKFEVREFPLNIAIEPGNFCNLNCISCANNTLTRKRGNMNVLLFKKIIDEIAEENPHTRIWLDYYGEPLLQKYKLYYMIDYARKKGLTNININTNGTLMDEEIAEMLLDAGLTFVSVDCDGYSKEVYEKIRVRANRDITYKNIEYLLQRKRERGLKYPIVEVKVMEMEENKNEIDLILDYWRKRGAWTAKRRLISWGGKVENIKPKAQENRVACGTAVGIMVITWEGDVVNCVMDVDASHVFGNIGRESIKDIWQRIKTDLIEPQIRHEWEKLPDICQDCTDWMIVGEIRYDEKGNLVEKNYKYNQNMLNA